MSDRINSKKPNQANTPKTLTQSMLEASYRFAKDKLTHYGEIWLNQSQDAVYGDRLRAAGMTVFVIKRLTDEDHNLSVGKEEAMSDIPTGKIGGISVGVDRVRGKFFVLGIEQQHGYQGRTIKLGAVSASDKEKSENNMYHKYTPSGEIKMFIDNPQAEAFFSLGKVVYVDFTEAPKD